jgi:nucleotide-binding universal stress UspA family protein
MFDTILIPISSEFYSKDVLQRSISLANKLHSKLHVMYIIEEKTLKKSEERMESYRTDYQRTALKEELVNEQVQTADSIVFQDAKQLLLTHNVLVEEKIVSGQFSDAVAKEVQQQHYDLILMGYGKECSLRYRLFDHVDIPIWVVAGTEKQTLLAVCSNLAPNQKVPEMSKQLSKLFHWPLHLIYIVDPHDPVEVDAQENRLEKKPLRELVADGTAFIKEKRAQGFEASITVGPLEKETMKAAKKYDANLIVVGREQKKHTFLDVTGKSTKRKIAETCGYSVLFLH